jgi:hypothetical protein
MTATEAHTSDLLVQVLLLAVRRCRCHGAGRVAGFVTASPGAEACSAQFRPNSSFLLVIVQEENTRCFCNPSE